MDYKEPEQIKHISEYVYILTKNKWLILCVFIVVLGLTILYNSRLKPVYRSTATMVIESERRKSPITGQILDYESFYFGNLAFNTHSKLITSRPVLERVIRDLKIDQSRRESELETSGWKRLYLRMKENFWLLIGKGGKSAAPSERQPILRKSLTSKIDIKAVKDTNLLKIGIEDNDPLVAQSTANSLVKAYIEFNIENRLKSSRNTLTWMTDQLYEMKKKLEDAEEEFLAFKQQERLFSITGKQQVISQRIQDFNNAYLETRNRRLEVEANLSELQRSLKPNGDVLYARSLIHSALVETLYTQLLDTETERSRLSQVFKSKHPKMIQINTKIANTERNLQDEIRKEVDNLNSERSSLLVREKVLQKTMSDFEGDALGTSRKELQYTMLERNVATYRNLYDTLLSKVKESNVVDTIDVSNIRIAEKAALPSKPIRPNKNRNLMFATIFGLLLGICFAFLREYIDRTLRTEDDIASYIGLPVLSVIPRTESRALRGS